MAAACPLVVVALVAGACSVRMNSEESPGLDPELYAQESSYHTIHFDRLSRKAATPFTVDSATGQVMLVPANSSVKEGWFVHKLQHHYPWSVFRWEAMLASADGIDVTFTEALVSFSCRDLPSTWMDSTDRNCNDYQRLDLCSSYGTTSAGWPRCRWWSLFCRGKTFDSYRRNGLNAAEACCACGGGWDPTGETTTVTTTTTTTTTVTTTTVSIATDDDAQDNAPSPSPTRGPGSVCRDISTWRDSLGYDCDSYTTQDWCSLPNLDGYADESGHSAHDSCCACGGGRYEVLEEDQRGAAASSAGAVSMAILASLVLRLFV